MRRTGPGFIKRVIMEVTHRLGLEIFLRRPLPDPALLATHPELALNVWMYGRVNNHVRVRAHDVVDEYLRTRQPTGVHEGDIPRRVWMYWDQGWDDVPPMVQACRRRLERFADGFDVVLLDRDNLADHTGLPPVVRTNTGSNRTAYSEALRFDLLARHGGVWLDATCWLTRPLEALLGAADRGYFSYRQHDEMSPGWLAVSPPGHVIPVTMRDLLADWWSTTDEHPAYFWYIYLFEAACYRIPAFSEAWFHRPSEPGLHGNLLARVLDRPFDPRLMAAIESLTFVQKLTYKRPDAFTPIPGTFAAHVLADVPHVPAPR